MANTAYSTSQTTLGLGLETTRGTAATTVSWMPVKSPKYKPNLTLITDNTLQGSMVETYGMTPGLRFDSHGWDAFPQLDTFPLLLKAVLGSPDTLTTAPTSTTLSAPATAGATTVTTTAAVTAHSFITIGSGETGETHYVSSVATNTATLETPIRFAQPSGATVTGLTGHTFSLLNNAGAGNQPPSCTIQDYDGQQWRQITAAQLSKLTLKGNATGLVDYTVEFMGDSATIMGTPPVPSFTTTQPTPGWTTQLLLGGNPINYLVDWEIDFDRKVGNIPAFTGTQNYYLHYAGPIAPTGKFTFVEQSGAPQLTQYLSGVSQPVTLSVQDVSSGFQLRVHFSSAVYTTGEVDRSKAYAEVPLDVTPTPTAADATAGGVSPVTVSVGNSTITAY